MENNEKQVRLSFAAIDPYIERNIVSPKETYLRNKDMVEWGDKNAYPDYLLDLSKTTPTLRSIILGTRDYILGDAQTILPLGSLPAGIMNAKGETIRQQVETAASNILTYGGFALQVVRSLTGTPAEVYVIDLRFLRTNKDDSVFYYSEKWNKGRTEALVYPAYQPISAEAWAAMDEKARNRVASSILFVKGESTQAYPLPPYCAAVKACEIERGIGDYHLNALENSFTGSVMVNFNNGLPSDAMRKEIERNFNEKLSGHENGGRIGFSWNDDKEHATTIESLKVEDFGARYDALSKYSRQQIFTAFRANPNLFGIPTENLGFSQEEYDSAFRLYNRTCVRPAQRIICDAYDKIYGQVGVLTITPFSLTETAGEAKVQ